jgi:trimeric autotransporter adhesin
VVNTPLIAALDPAAVMKGGAAFTLAVEGSGFAPGAVVQLNGIALVTSFVTAAELNAQVSAAQVNAAGPLSIVVSNPGGALSNKFELDVVSAPSINAITPTTVAAGSASFTLTVEGSGFAPGAAMELNGIPLATTAASIVQLRALVPSAQVAKVGALSVTIVNPGPPPQTSNAETLKVVNTPVIGSIDPPAVIEGSAAFALTVAGSGFVSGSVVQLDGTALATNFVNATQLEAQVPAAQVAQVAQLSVVTVNPGATVSNAQTLEVVAAPDIASIAPAAITAGSGAFTLIVLGKGFVSGSVVQLNGTDLQTTFVNSGHLDAHVPRSGYTTGDDGTFVLFFDGIKGRSEVVTLIAAHPKFPNPKSLQVTVLRGATVSIGIDMTS